MSSLLRLRVRIVQAMILVIGLLCMCAVLVSQGSDGRIGGTILDPSGGAIPGAVVTLTDAERGVARQLSTDTAGSYAAPNLPPGIYAVRVEFRGFRTVDRKDIVLQVGQELQIDLTMQPGEQAQTITVTGEP